MGPEICKDRWVLEFMYTRRVAKGMQQILESVYTCLGARSRSNGQRVLLDYINQDSIAAQHPERATSVREVMKLCRHKDMVTA